MTCIHFDVENLFAFMAAKCNDNCHFPQYKSINDQRRCNIRFFFRSKPENCFSFSTRILNMIPPKQTEDNSHSLSTNVFAS